MDPDIKALKREGFINQGSTLVAVGLSQLRLGIFVLRDVYRL